MGKPSNKANSADGKMQRGWLAALSNWGISNKNQLS